MGGGSSFFGSEDRKWGAYDLRRDYLNCLPSAVYPQSVVEYSKGSYWSES